MSTFATIDIQREGPLAWVILNRPRVLNVYNVQMRDDLYETLALLEADPDIRVVVFRGAGERAFCAGADLTEFGSAPSQAIARRVRFERDVWARLLNMRKPLIAAIHGFCLGSGLEIALCCDLRITAGTAKFGLPETGLGMIPAAGATQTLPRLIPRALALEMLLTGRIVEAPEALRSGLVNELSADPFKRASTLAHDLAQRESRLLASLKEAVAAGSELPLEAGLRLEQRLVAQLSA